MSNFDPKPVTEFPANRIDFRSTRVFTNNLRMLNAHKLCYHAEFCGRRICNALNGTLRPHREDNDTIAPSLHRSGDDSNDSVTMRHRNCACRTVATARPLRANFCVRKLWSFPPSQSHVRPPKTHRTSHRAGYKFRVSARALH